MKAEIDWHLAGRALPEPGRRVFFCVPEDGGEFHAGERLEVERVGTRFVSDKANSVGERDWYEVSEVWCWAYPPEVPT